MTDITYAQVWADHIISVGEPGEVTTVTVLSGDTVYYGDSRVSPTTNRGSLTQGQSTTSTPVLWLVSASTSFVQISGDLIALGGAVSSVYGRTGVVTATSGDYTAAQVTNAGDKASASQQAFTAEVKAADFTPAGLPGAAAASRYVGATTAGAPASGTFLKGDWCVDQTGKRWTCTTAGSPGVWIQEPGSGGAATAAVVVALGNVTGTVTCDLSLGTAFTGTLTGDTTINFSNWPASPALTEPLLILTQDGTGGHSITITGVVWEPAGSTPAFDTVPSHVNFIPLSSPDQGTHLYGNLGSSAGATTGRAVTKTTTYGLTSTDQVVLVDATSATFTVTLPTAVGFSGRYVIRAINTNTNLVTVATTSAQTIDGLSTTTVGPQASGAVWAALELVSDGANWRSI